MDTVTLKCEAICVSSLEYSGCKVTVCTFSLDLGGGIN